MNNPNDLYAITQELNQQAEHIVRQIIADPTIQRQGHELRIGRKGSMRVFISGPKTGRWTNYEDGSFGDMLDLIQAYTGQTTADAIQTAKAMLGWSDDHTIIAPTQESRQQEKEAQQAQEQQERNKRIRRARAIWHHGTPVTTGHPYLIGRGIPTIAPTPWLRQETIAEQDRVYMHLPDTIDDAPIEGLLCGATTADGSLAAVQRILIQHNKKLAVDTPKRTYGYMVGAAVRFDEPTDHLYVGEGPETSLAWRSHTHTPTWCILGLSNLLHIDVPVSVTHLHILVDLEEDGAGILGAIRAANALRNRRPEQTVTLHFPHDPMVADIHLDFNDLCQHDAHHTMQDVAMQYAITAPDPDPGHIIITNHARLALQAWTHTGATIYSLPKKREEITLTALAMQHIIPDTHAITLIGPRNRLGDPRDLPDAITLTWIDTEDGQAHDPFVTPIQVHRDRPGAPIIMTGTPEDAEWITGPTAYWPPTQDPDLYDWTPLAGRNIILAFAQTEQGMKGAALAARYLEAVGGIVWMGRMPPKRIPVGVSPFDGRGFTIGRAKGLGWTPDTLRSSLIAEATRISMSLDAIVA